MEVDREVDSSPVGVSKIQGPFSQKREYQLSKQKYFTIFPQM
jgi:hypothetical protein